jgi:hypothetical protein
MSTIIGMATMRNTEVISDMTYRGREFVQVLM